MHLERDWSGRLWGGYTTGRKEETGIQQLKQGDERMPSVQTLKSQNTTVLNGVLSRTMRGLRLYSHANKWICLSCRVTHLRHGTSEVRHRGLCFLGPNKPHGVHDQDGSPCSPCLRNDTEWSSEDTGPIQVPGRWGSNAKRWRWIGSPIITLRGCAPHTHQVP